MLKSLALPPQQQKPFWWTALLIAGAALATYLGTHLGDVLTGTDLDPFGPPLMALLLVVGDYLRKKLRGQ
jgi:hypothetical protein